MTIISARLESPMSGEDQDKSFRVKIDSEALVILVGYCYMQFTGQDKAGQPLTGRELAAALSAAIEVAASRDTTRVTASRDPERELRDARDQAHAAMAALAAIDPGELDRLYNSTAW